MYRSILKKQASNDILIPNGYCMDILRCRMDLFDANVETPLELNFSPNFCIINVDGRTAQNFSIIGGTTTNITLPRRIRVSTIKKRNGVIDWNNPVSKIVIERFTKNEGFLQSFQIANDDAYITISLPLQNNDVYYYRDKGIVLNIQLSYR